MTKKRKNTNRRLNEPKAFDPKEGTLGPIRTYEDIAGSEDEFHIQRNKVLLDDEPDAKRRKKWEDEDEFLVLSDEEILGYSESEIEDEEHENEDEGRGSKSLIKNTRSANKAVDGSEAEENEDKDEDAGGWGSLKRDYYDADQIETEADALEEEAEAKRLQQKRLQKMSEADFGFDSAEWLDTGVDDNNGDVITEVLKDVEITPDMGSEERLRLLKTRYPEFEALANEYLQLQPILKELDLEVNNGAISKSTTGVASRAAILKWRAVAAYLGALTMYFAVLTSAARSGDGNPTALDPLELRDHSVMESLLQCRELWSKVKDLKLPAENQSEEISRIAEMDIPQPITEDAISTTQIMQPKKSKKERRFEAAAAKAAKTRAELIHTAEEELQDLSLLPKSKKSFKLASIKPISQDIGSDSDFGEEVSLSARAAAEKAAKKKSLRFYTSQIAQKANRRADAGRDAGGDADLPYRERLRDRQARLNAEAEKRGKRLDDYGRGAALGGESDDNYSETKNASEIRGEEDEYYDFVAQISRKKKEVKAERSAAAAEAKAADKMFRVIEGEVGEDGKRAIGYVIEKNKGLAPKRKKDVRNPRVKKRKKFEEKKKKLGSIRAVYKGGEEKGGYGGEKTGIKTGLVKSIKL